MRNKILDPGCGNCHTLETRTRQALGELGATAEISAVTDYPSILEYGVMSTPALVVDEQVVLSGRVPTIAQLKELLSVPTSTVGGARRRGVGGHRVTSGLTSSSYLRRSW